MVLKACGQCGAGFDATRNQRHCPGCRRPTRPARAAEAASAAAAAELAGAQLPDGVLASVRAELARAGQSDTPLGRQAIVLAARLDVGSDFGSAMAAMSKELRAVMAEATRSAPAVADPVDDLRQRRRRRAASAG